MQFLRPDSRPMFPGTALESLKLPPAIRGQHRPSKCEPWVSSLGLPNRQMNTVTKGPQRTTNTGKDVGSWGPCTLLTGRQNGKGHRHCAEQDAGPRKVKG